MIERLTSAYAAQGDATDLSKLVHDMLQTGQVADETAQNYLQEEQRLHASFHDFVDERRAVETRQYQAVQGTRRWQVVAHQPVVLVDKLKAIPFTEYDISESGWQRPASEKGRTTPPRTPYEMLLVERAIGFIITATTARQALVSKVVSRPWETPESRRVGLIKRVSPSVIRDMRLGISNADLENQRRFGSFLSEVVAIDNTNTGN